MARYTGPQILLPRAQPSGPPLKYRKLRIGFSAVCAITCVLMIAFWFRRYRRNEVTAVIRNSTAISVASRDGRLFLSVERMPVKNTLIVNSNPIKVRRPQALFQSFLWHNRPPAFIHFAIPYWLPALLSLVLAGLTWVGWSTRFSLRTLFIATTLLAIALGFIAAATQQ